MLERVAWSPITSKVIREADPHGTRQIQALPHTLPRVPATNKMNESNSKHESHRPLHYPQGGIHSLARSPINPSL